MSRLTDAVERLRRFLPETLPEVPLADFNLLLARLAALERECKAWRAEAEQAWAGRWCDDCRSGCSGDDDLISHWPECPRAAAEAARAATDALEKE